ncbi:MAG: hypothetical protein JOZ09_19100 [Pseudonocardiales bacterium]|nr:hypothetical protein [Pseudonocardiales bacterium]
MDLALTVAVAGSLERGGFGWGIGPVERAGDRVSRGAELAHPLGHSGAW